MHQLLDDCRCSLQRSDDDDDATDVTVSDDDEDVEDQPGVTGAAAAASVSVHCVLDQVVHSAWYRDQCGEQ